MDRSEGNWTGNTVRIIARLDIKGPNLVKGVHLEGLRVLGKPWAYAKHYAAQGIDELLYMDAVASLYDRNGLLDFVECTAREVFVPITVGGGIRTLDDISAALRVGADKVAINTAAIKDPGLITRAAQRFGASTIVGSIEAQQCSTDRYECYMENGRQPTGIDVVEWARELADRGAGEILLTAVHREGTGSGFDLDLIRRVERAVPVPVIASGGAGSASHAADALHVGGVSAVAIASMFHYEAINTQRIRFEDFSGEGNTSFLRSGTSGYRSEAIGIGELKKELVALGIPCRPFVEQETWP